MQQTPSTKPAIEIAPSTAATPPKAERFRLAHVAVPFLLFSLFAILPAFAQFGAEGYILSLVMRVMIFAIAAMSLDLILGYGAMVSFGHAAFIGIGAYGAGILMQHMVDDFFLQLATALGGSAFFALVTGALSLRTKGVYFIMITLAFGQMAFFFFVSLAAYGGDDGMTLRSTPLVFGQDWLAHPHALYYLIFGCMLGVYFLLRAIVRSRFGRVLRGAKENPVRMEAVGFNPYRFQLAAYVIAGTICGLAGFLLAHQTEFIAPAFMTWQRSGELIVMVVLGGMGTLHGAIIGAAAFLILEEMLSRITQDWKLIFGPFLVLVALFARGGIMGFLRRWGLK